MDQLDNISSLTMCGPQDSQVGQQNSNNYGLGYLQVYSILVFIHQHWGAPYCTFTQRYSLYTIGIICHDLLMNPTILPIEHYSLYRPLMWVKQCHKPSPYHHFYRWYKPFPNGWFMALVYPHLAK